VLKKVVDWSGASLQLQILTKRIGGPPIGQCQLACLDLTLPLDYQAAGRLPAHNALAILHTALEEHARDGPVSFDLTDAWNYWHDVLRTTPRAVLIWRTASYGLRLPRNLLQRRRMGSNSFQTLHECHAKACFDLGAAWVAWVAWCSLGGLWQHV
jgi:hypothetical protein